MVTVYYDQDADLQVLANRTVAVIGYGNQGRAQALNMRDSGVDVVIGGRPGPSLEQAQADGLPIMSISEAVGAADVVSLLLPDEVHRAVYEQDIEPVLKAGQTLNFAHGYNICYGRIRPKAGVDVVMIAPRMIGVGVRDSFVAGAGAPAFVAVEQDASGHAWQTLLALAKAIGATRSGAFQVTFAEETELDLFSEQVVWPVVSRILSLSYEVLVESGYQAEPVLLELYASGEPAIVMQGMADVGLFRQMARVSRTSQYGTLTRGPVMIPDSYKALIAERLEEIRNGSFAREWGTDQDAGRPTYNALRKKALSHPINDSEDRLHSLIAQPGANKSTAED